MKKQELIFSTITPGGKRLCGKETLENYLYESQKFEDPQNPSKYKEIDFVGKEPGEYHTVPETERTDGLFFQNDSIWIYNSDILKINDIFKDSIDLIVTSPPYNVDIVYNQK